MKNVVISERKDRDGTIIQEKVEYKALNYEGFIPILTEAIKEQQAQIESQIQTIEELKMKVEFLENSYNSLVYSESNDLNTAKENDQKVVLFQNRPNPFSENTEIEFSIPFQFDNALISITNLQGLQLIKIKIPNESRGSIIINAQDLSSGIYYYSLII
ncbi:T9SS type A sorting domain-containing protein, partial [Bacteroidota bacterium]